VATRPRRVAPATPKAPCNLVRCDPGESGGDAATADRKRSDKGLMQRGAVVRFGAGPFRWRLSNSAAGNDPAADELAAQAERAGEWTVVMAIRAAQQAGKDWRPGVAEARRCMVADANRLPTRCMVRMRSVADIGRLDDWPGGTCGTNIAARKQLRAAQDGAQTGWHPHRRHSAPRPCPPARET
jgi:hypothetical protein